ncbi:DUF6615 family protein [Brucella pituitosa]|uniref:DUF6615 family protein n=1 Tax=Brucella pituitosa TaxID=571256 RepID=UPI0009A167C9|nr:DUF6615 family protein [Brucella pituitosa]
MTINPSLCDTFLELETAVSQNLARSYSSHISYGEETITESCLLEIWRRHSAIVKIQTFTKAQEAKNGADWEWHLIGKTYTLKMRVQAKRLRKGAKRISGLLDYKAKSASHLQVDLLIGRASSQNLMPVFCLYSPEKYRQTWVASSMPSPFEAGCLMGDATKIKAAFVNDLVALEKLTVPWHHLVCPKTPNLNQTGFLNVDFLNNGVSKGLYLPPYIQPTNIASSPIDGETSRLAVEFGIIGRIEIDCRDID